MSTKEEKKSAFMEKAAKNLENFDIHKKLIADKLENWNGLRKASIEHFFKTGKVSGSFFLALMDYAETYHILKKEGENQICTPDIAEKIIKARDAFVERDYNEVWHNLYSIASPNYDKKDPWKDLEEIAKKNNI